MLACRNRQCSESSLVRKHVAAQRIVLLGLQAVAIVLSRMLAKIFSHAFSSGHFLRAV